MTKPQDTDSVIPSHDSAPRQRVTRLMQRLVKAAAFGGAALGLAATESCSPLVCDPLPPPMTCPNPTHNEVLSSLDFTATWADTDGGASEVSLQVNAATRNSVTFSTLVTVTDGVATGPAKTTPSSLTLTVAPDAGKSSVAVVVNYTCTTFSGAQAGGTLTLTLDVSGTPAAGTSVPVTLTAP